MFSSFVIGLVGCQTSLHGFMSVSSFRSSEVSHSSELRLESRIQSKLDRRTPASLIRPVIGRVSERPLIRLALDLTLYCQIPPQRATPFTAIRTVLRPNCRSKLIPVRFSGFRRNQTSRRIPARSSLHCYRLRTLIRSSLHHCRQNRPLLDGI